MKKTTAERKKAAQYAAGKYDGEFRTEVGTLFYVVDGVRVAKKVGDDWVTLVPGWHVGEGWRESLDPDIPSGPVTSVEYDPYDA